MYPKGVKLRWQPLGLLNVFDVNLTLGAEYFYAERRSVYLDAGYIFASAFSQNNGGAILPTAGMQLRGGHRWYLGNSTPWFVETDARYKHVKYAENERWVGRNVVNGIPSFSELVRYNEKKDIITVEGKVGLLGRFGRNGNCAIESWIGLGLRYRNFYADLPADAQFFDDNFDFINYGRYTFLNVPLGLRLTWQLNAPPKPRR
ncbi:MAG: hypothetical protein EAY75_17370 [Bacteroidetes bacterium]|nr:MAG: hypothetical protein EAY75_17370 [Bacteroidota bacterium]